MPTTRGALTTPPLVFSGRRLVINQNCSGQETIFVELHDVNDQPIPGYTLGGCEEITYKDVFWEVRLRWQSRRITAGRTTAQGSFSDDQRQTLCFSILNWLNTSNDI